MWFVFVLLKGTDWNIIADDMLIRRFGLLQLILDMCK